MEIHDIDAYVDTEFSVYESFKSYCCIMCLFLYKFYESKMISESIKHLGLSLSHYVFMEFLYHSQNIEFTHHHCEQAILMFFEYMNQSNSFMIRLNPIDAYRFVMKKTICLIPIHMRHQSIEKNHPGWNKLSMLFGLWYQWCIHVISCEDYKTTHELLVKVSNLCQSIEKYTIDEMKKHQEFHELLFSMTIPIEQKIALALRCLSEPFDISAYRKTWLELSLEHECSQWNTKSLKG